MCFPDGPAGTATRQGTRCLKQDSRQPRLPCLLSTNKKLSNQGALILLQVLKYSCWLLQSTTGSRESTSNYRHSAPYTAYCAGVTKHEIARNGFHTYCYIQAPYNVIDGRTCDHLPPRTLCTFRSSACISEQAPPHDQSSVHGPSHKLLHRALK